MVTEEALHVSPELLGLPLAAPWRRGLAITVDGLLIALLSSTPSVLLAAAAAYVLLRASARRTPGGGYVRRSLRFSLRAGAAIFLFVVVLNLWNKVTSRFGGDDDGPVQASITAGDSGTTEESMEVSGLEAVRFATEVVALRRAGNEDEARRTAEELLARMRASGISGQAARDGLRDLVEDAEDQPWLISAVEEVAAADAEAERTGAGEPPAGQRQASADSLASAYATALQAGDSAAADSLRPALTTALSADTVRALDERYAALEGDRRQLEQKVEALEQREEEGPGLIALIRRFLDDLGLGLGWSGLYFTATTALWQGRTPGKRLFGIRVIRLTGKPIGWWASFERFGGYAAGFATGLLGFLQILWDDNRQAIHDKIAVTAVIRDHPHRPLPPSGREA